MGIETQSYAVPDWDASTSPTPSAWVKNRFTRIARAALVLSSTGADVVTLLGSANDTDPVDASNPNVIATFYGGKAAKVDVPACTFFAVLREPPPPVGGVRGTPTSGLVLEVQGADEGACATPMTTWRVMVDPDVLPPGAHDLRAPALALLNTVTFPGPVMIGNVATGYRVETVAVGVFTGEPGPESYLAWGLVVEVTDVSSGVLLSIPRAIGGNAADPTTGLPPATGNVGAPPPVYGEPVTEPLLRIYTSGAATITGEVDLMSLEYPLGPGSVDVSSDRGSGTVSMSGVMNPGAVVDAFNMSAPTTGVVAMLTGANRLVLVSRTTTPAGQVAIADGAIARQIGFPGGASAADGCPTFGQLDAAIKLDVTVKAFVASVFPVIA